MVALTPIVASHPWRLVGPWYRWQRAAFPADGRRSAPVFQKFAGGDFVNGFIASPQHSLVFDPTVDVVSNIDLLPAASGGNLAGKLAALFATKSDGTPVLPSDAGDANVLKSLHRARLVPSDLRKLYLPIHDRHYLVVCELHCDVPAFPTVPRGEVCQAGFVVRRRQRVVPDKLAKEAALRAQDLRNDEAELAELRERSPLRDDLAAKRKSKLRWLVEDGDFDGTIAKMEAGLKEKRSGLYAWFEENGITTRVEGWIPDVANGTPSKILGSWRELTGSGLVGDTTATEHWFPLYPLIPDANDKRHDAAGRTLYFGIVPTTSLQHDASGQARFDDASTYESRCFVRRHNPRCPKSSRVPDCHGGLVWSDPTEPYRLAAPFDPLGSANRPITIKMPDLRELAAQVAARPRGTQSPVKFVQPQHLSPKASNGAASGGDLGGNAICFFSIPLITIIALFVLNLFLPIVVFIFQLWFLLLFRFCIPPQVKFGASLDAKLAAQPPGVDFDADFKVSLDGMPMATALELNAALKANLELNIGAETGSNIAGKLDNFSNNALGSLDQSFTDNSNIANDDDPANPPRALDYGAGLVYEPHRDPAWQLVGGRG